VKSARRGEIWMADLDPVVGHEQAGKRPAVVVSSDDFNRMPVGLVVVVPFTTTDRNLPLHVAVEPPDGGLRKKSFAMAEHVRCVSTRRFIKRLGRISTDKLTELEETLKALLALDD